mgnify:CR=1 FL=1
MKSGIIYKGPSLLDGKPIVVIATLSNRNSKTGNVVQTYILKSDTNPLEASKTGTDSTICGICVMRGTPTTDPKRKIAKDRPCYVNLGQGVLIVFKAFERGVYPMADCRTDRRQLGADRVVRMGTYGDPAAVPSYVWDDLLMDAESHLGYTHQPGWRPDIAMQSADTYEQAQEFWAKGMRTFRVVVNVLGVDYTKEILCPASKEAGRRVQCTDCKLCNGSSKAKSIAIVEH